MKIEIKDSKKEERCAEEEKWKIEDAIRSFENYQKIIKEKGMKEKVKKAMEDKAKEILEASKQI